jgi:hypothetical protein
MFLHLFDVFYEKSPFLSDYEIPVSIAAKMLLHEKSSQLQNGTNRLLSLPLLRNKFSPTRLSGLSLFAVLIAPRKVRVRVWAVEKKNHNSRP